MNSLIKKVSLLILVSLLFFLTISDLLHQYIGTDSGYYLATARDFYNGKIYFIDIATPYNPLSIVILGIPFLFSDSPNPAFSLLINFIFIWGSAYFLFKILQRINKNDDANFFYSLFFVLVVLVLDGSQLMLEPISVFFQLLGLTFYLKSKESNKYHYLTIAGICFACSFLAKQYGLFILAPIGIDILLSKRAVLKRIFFIGIGFFLSILSFYCYLACNGATFYEFVNYIMGMGVKLDTRNRTGINYSLLLLLLAILKFLILNLYLVLIPVLIFLKKKNIESKDYLFVLLFPFSLLIFLSAYYAHYFQYVLPYGLIAFVILLRNMDHNWQKLKSILFLISIIITGSISIISYSKKRAKIDFQEKFAKVLNENIPLNSKVYLDGPSPAFYFLCHFNSINSNVIGYTFPGYFYPKTIVKHLDDNDFLVVSQNKYSLYKKWLQHYKIKKIMINEKCFFVIKKVKK